MEKYVVVIFAENKEEIEVTGKPIIDTDGYLRFGRDNFVFQRGQWTYYYKVEGE